LAHPSDPELRGAFASAAVVSSYHQLRSICLLLNACICCIQLGSVGSNAFRFQIVGGKLYIDTTGMMPAGNATINWFPAGVRLADLRVEIFRSCLRIVFLKTYGLKRNSAFQAAARWEHCRRRSPPPLKPGKDCSGKHSAPAASRCDAPIIGFQIGTKCPILHAK
jgi:hypothetical protein